MPETRTTYFCVDIETSGPVPSLYDMISIGAVVVAPDETGSLALGADFYIEIQPQAPRFDTRTIPIHGLSFEHLQANGTPRRDAMVQLAEWTNRNLRDGTKPTFVGHNAPFDWSFIAWTYAAEEMDNPFGYKAMCTKSLASGVLGLHWFDSNKEILTARLGLPAEDHRQKHRADYDARFQAEILIRLLEKLEERG
ncbi:MAG: 3'-5' exonuclease [Myxococcota bacterium]